MSDLDWKQHVAESERFAGHARTGRDDHGAIDYSREVAVGFAIQEALLAVADRVDAVVYVLNGGGSI